MEGGKDRLKSMLDDKRFYYLDTHDADLETCLFLVACANLFLNPCHASWLADGTL